MHEPTSLDVDVCGRGRLTASAKPHHCGVIIRIDDKRNDEFWAEVHLDADQMQALLDQVRECQQQEAAEVA